MTMHSVFLGCQIPFRYPCFEIAAKKIFERTGFETRSMPGYSCCPEPVYSRLLDKTSLLAISARNLAIAESQGTDVVTLCNGCYETLYEANEVFRHDPQEAVRVNKVLSSQNVNYGGRVKVKHVVEALYKDVGIQRIRELISRPQDMRVAIHYGCHMYRGPEHEDVMAKPSMMRELVHATGARIVEYGLERLCCGYPSMQISEEFSLRERLLPKLRAAKNVGADAVIISCPACMIQLEMGQIMLSKLGHEYRIPCINLTELLALAFGVSSKELHFEFHRIPPLKLALLMEDS